MQTDFWIQRWQANQIGFHQDQINPYLPACWPQMAVAAGARVFVPLSGKSLDMWWLRDQGHPVIGIELSPIAVSDFFSAAGVEPERSRSGNFDQCNSDGLTLLCGDFFALKRDQLADIAAVYDRAALIAMPPSMRPAYAGQMINILPANCPILLITMEYPAEQMQGPPFPVGEDEVRALFSAHYHIDRLAQTDILDQMPRFRQRGITELTEKVFMLRPQERTAPAQK